MTHEMMLVNEKKYIVPAQKIVDLIAKQMCDVDGCGRKMDLSEMKVMERSAAVRYDYCCEVIINHVIFTSSGKIL